MNRKKLQNQLPTLCLAVGFLIGILYGNIASQGQGVLGSLKQSLQTEIISEEYLWYVVKLRLIPLAVLLVLGCLPAKRLVAVISIVWVGFLTGVFMVDAVIQLGIFGVLFCFIGLFPHIIFYVMSYGMFLLYLYYHPNRQWNVPKTVFLILTLALGIILETYVNPMLLRWFALYLG